MWFRFVITIAFKTSKHAFFPLPKMDLQKVVPVFEDIWRCEKCGHETSSQSYLAVHMAYTHQDFKLFKSVQSDHNNQEAKLEDPTKCDNSKAISDNYKVKSDNGKVTGDNPKVTGDNPKVKGDNPKVKSDNAKAKPKVRCKKCPYTTSNVADMKLHIKSVHKKVNLKCWYCDFTALTKVELTEHMNKHGYNTLADASVEPIHEKDESDSGKTANESTMATLSKLDGRDVTTLGSVELIPENQDSDSSTTPIHFAQDSTLATSLLESIPILESNFPIQDKVRPKHDTSELKSGDSEVINRYLNSFTPTLESLPNSAGMSASAPENCDSQTPLNLAKEPTPVNLISENGPTLREVIKGEADSILSRVLGEYATRCQYCGTMSDKTAKRQRGSCRGCLRLYKQSYEATGNQLSTAGHQQAKKSPAPSESSESSGYVTGTDVAMGHDGGTVNLLQPPNLELRRYVSESLTY